MTEQIERVRVVTRRAQIRQEVIPIMERSGQPVDQNHRQAIALLYKIYLCRDIIRRAPRLSGIFHIVSQVLCATPCQ